MKLKAIEINLISCTENAFIIRYTNSPGDNYSIQQYSQPVLYCIHRLSQQVSPSFLCSLMVGTVGNIK
jgi:hypothetical protein